ncbi:hypothetical protein MASR2M69_23930 [Bacteroidota bacterium]
MKIKNSAPPVNIPRNDGTNCIFRKKEKKDVSLLTEKMNEAVTETIKMSEIEILTHFINL